MSLERRLQALEKPDAKNAEPWTITVWLHHFDGRHVTGPDGKHYTHEEAERLQADADMVIDLRRTREP